MNRRENGRITSRAADRYFHRTSGTAAALIKAGMLKAKRRGIAWYIDLQDAELLMDSSKTTEQLTGIKNRDFGKPKKETAP